jgi:hypothetical protein
VIPEDRRPAVAVLPPRATLADPHRDEHARDGDDDERLDDRSADAAVRDKA